MEAIKFKEDIMKKRLLPILLLVLAMVFTGCTSTQLEFWAKSQETQNWSGAETKGTMNMSMTMQGEKIDFVVDMDGFTNTADVSGYMNMSIKANMPSDLAPSFEIKDIKMYIKDGKIAISKNYFTEIFKVMGQEVPSEFANLDADYIMLTYTDEQTEMILNLMKNPEGIKEIYKLYEEVAKDMGFDVEVTKKDNTYSIDLDQTEILEVLKKVIVTTTDNLEVINEKFPMGLTQEDIKMAQADMAEVKPQLDQMFAMASAMFTGSFKMDTTFEDDKVNQKIAFTVDDPTLTQMSLSMNADMTSTKIDAKEVTMPEKVLEISPEELANSMVVKMVFIDQTEGYMMDAEGNEIPCKTIVKDNKTFVPAKTVLGGLGKEVIYDAATKKVGFKVNDEFTALNVITEKGTSYISLDELKGLGFTVDVMDGFIQIQ